jgi:hypothetical protein
MLWERLERLILSRIQNGTGYRYFHCSVFALILMPVQLCPQHQDAL